MPRHAVSHFCALPQFLHLVTCSCRLFQPQRLSSPAFSTVSVLSSHLLVQPASFQLLHVSHPSIFSLVVLFSSFHLRVPASFFFPVRPSDRITCPKNPSFLFSAVYCSVSSSSIPMSMRTLSLVFFSVCSELLVRG